MRCPRPQKLDGARLCTSTQEKFKSSRSPSSPSYHLIRSNQVPASRRVETQLCLIFCTHWAHLAEHFIERSPTPSRAFASETSARTSCRFDTSSPVPRWCVPRPILVLLAHRQPPRSLLPPADQHPLPIVASGCRCVLCPRRVQSLRGRVGGDRGRDRAQRTQRQDQVGKT